MIMRDAFFEKIDLLCIWCFRAHDFASGLLVKYFLSIKKVILAVAYGSLLGIFFPELGGDYGNASITVLFVIVFLSPLATIFRIRLLLQMMGLRRELGILMGFLAIVHGMTYLIPVWGTDMSLLPLYFWLGFGALFLTLPLLLTSNTFSLRLFGGKRWKMIHYLVYPLFIVAVFHESLRFGGVVVWSDKRVLMDFAQGIGIICLYGLLKLLAWKNFLLPLERGITCVAGRYAGYRKKESIRA